jgi:dihydroorotate dehydrogenase (NAD+) catalytic subunit
VKIFLKRTFISVNGDKTLRVKGKRENTLNQNLLSLNVAGLELRNPTALASGILGYTAASLGSIAENGAGAVVTKSVGVNPRMGYANPTVVQAQGGLINAMGLPNPGIAEYVGEIVYAKTILKVPLIVSIFGYSAEEYAEVAEKAVKAGADAVELNVSCPHVKQTGSEIGQNAKLLAEVVSHVKGAVGKPVIVKLSPNVSDIVEIAKVAVKAGADALTAINTVKALAIDVETELPVLSNIRGGLSGPAIKPVALRCVYDLFESVKVPIIGCGGITTWEDAVQFFLAGATMVQVGSAVGLESPSVFKAVNRGIRNYLIRKKFGNVKEIVGIAHRA